MEIEVKVNNVGGTVKAVEDDTQVGQLDFVFIKDGISIDHTRTFHGFEGKGVASALVEAANDYAVTHRLMVRPVCSYAEAWYRKHPQYSDVLLKPMTEEVKGVTKVYVMETCPDCMQVKAKLANNPAYELIDIGAHVRNLKEFLKLRDANRTFDEVKSKGQIGIPCFVLEDGTVQFSMDGLTIDEAPEGAACSIDGKGC